MPTKSLNTLLLRSKVALVTGARHTADLTRAQDILVLVERARTLVGACIDIFG